MPLQSGARFDVAIVGGGYTGLSAALHLAGAGAKVAVLEARSIGWGASGRAFGQVVPYLKHDHDSILAHYGAERGQRIVDAVALGPEFVFDLIKRHAIACDAVQTGLLFAAHTTAGKRTLERRTVYWQRRGHKVEMLDARETCKATGSADYYDAAMLDHRGGHLNPLAYTRGLALAAKTAGAAIHTGIEVRRLQRVGRLWQLATTTGSLEADCVVLATNAYSGRLWPGLSESFVAIRGHGIVSRPLSENLRRTILPGGQPLTDTRRLFSGVRMLAGGNLHVSLDGPPRGREEPSYSRSADARIASLFPHLGQLEWQETWSGWIAVTPDHYPRVHELAPGCYAGLGYSGRGIAAATLIGSEIAARLRGRTDGELAFPVTPLKAMRGHAFAGPASRLLIAAHRLADARDERRRSMSRRSEPGKPT